MKNIIKECLAAGGRAADYLTMMQRPGGGVTGEDFQMDIFHKLPYALSLAGRLPDAQRLVQWVVRERGFNSAGAVDFYLAPVRMQIYKHAWFVHGTHRIGRFDLSYPAFDFMCRAQAECGGFSCEDPEEGQVRALTTGWCGVAALYLNRLDIARKAGEAAIRFFDGQPEAGRFYFFMTPQGVVKQTLPDEGAEGAYKEETVIIQEKTDQYYWEIGMLTILLSRLYQVTREQRWLDYARKYFEFNLACQPDGFAHANAGKNGMGAALLYLITGDGRAREAALRECQFLLDTQEASGAWVLPPFPDGFVTRLDLASEYCIWLHEISGILHACE